MGIPSLVPFHFFSILFFYIRTVLHESLLGIIVVTNSKHAGKDDGGVSMMKVSESLSSITREEKSTLNSLFDLERRREKSLELLEREAALKERNKKNLKCIPRLIR